MSSLARAQAVVSTPTWTNASSPDETVLSGIQDGCMAGRRSQVSVVSPGGGTTFTMRYAATVFEDNELYALSCPARHEILDTDYTLTFTATAPRIYNLILGTRRSGDANVRNDSIPAEHDGQADQGPVTCAWTGGTLVGGGCDLGDPGPAILGGDVKQPYDQSNSLTLCATSDGAAVPHTVQFLWTQRAYSGAVNLILEQQGDDAAVRLGDWVSVGSASAPIYPGAPARTQSDDGHFTTATLVDLCGNGIIDACGADVEACDEGAANGSPASCCTDDCRLTLRSDHGRRHAALSLTQRRPVSSARASVAVSMKPRIRVSTWLATVHTWANGTSMATPPRRVFPFRRPRMTTRSPSAIVSSGTKRASNAA
jgi:hypothetical protein